MWYGSKTELTNNFDAPIHWGVRAKSDVCTNNSSIKDNGIWRTRQKNELHKFYYELDVVQVIKIGRMNCLGHLFRGQELSPCRKLTLLKPDGNRRVGKPKLRWHGTVKEELNNVGERNWRRNSQDRVSGRQFWKSLRSIKGSNVRRRSRRRRRRRRRRVYKRRLKLEALRWSWWSKGEKSIPP